jgi:cell division protein FtsW
LREVRDKNRYLDWTILAPYLLLSIFGIIMVYSSSSTILLVNGFKPATYAIRQTAYFISAVTLFGILPFEIKLDIFKSKKFVIGFLGLAVLMLLILIGMRLVRGDAAAVNGAVGWLNLGIIRIQPLEVAKIALVLYLAMVLSLRDGRFVPGKIWTNLSGPTILSGFVIFLVIVEPDFGGAAILMMIVLVMYAVSGIPARIVLRWFLVLLVLVFALTGLIILWNPAFLRNSYQFQRLMAFVHPFKLERKGGAQLVNSYYAIHNGHLLGVGLGNSMQKRGYLPEPYTDFILSIISEELGSFGAILVVGTLFFLMYRIMEVGVHAKDQFNALVCFGVATIIFTETLFNVGGVLGLLPITGVTLPFISYGGSSMIVLTFGIALVLNIAANEKRNRLENGGL